MSVQQSLTGEDVYLVEFDRPQTFVRCDECGEITLRSRRFDHEHTVDECLLPSNPKNTPLHEVFTDNE